LKIDYLPPEQLDGISQDILHLIPAKVATEYQVIPVAIQKENVHIAIAETKTLNFLDEIAYYTNGKKITPLLASRSLMMTALKRYYSEGEDPRKPTGGTLSILSPISQSAEPQYSEPTQAIHLKDESTRSGMVLHLTHLIDDMYEAGEVDDVAHIFLKGIAGSSRRAALFQLVDRTMHGYVGVGDSLDERRLRAFSFPVELANFVNECAVNGTFIGPNYKLVRSDRQFFLALGIPIPEIFLFLPIKVYGQIDFICFIELDASVGIDTEMFARLTRELGTAIAVAADG